MEPNTNENEIITYLGIKGMIIGHFQNNDIMNTDEV